MDSSINSLTPVQAQRALMIFSELLPDDLWEGGSKPSTARIEMTAETIQDDALPETQPLVNALTAEGNDEEKGAVAKALLTAFREDESLAGFVDEAVTKAQQPHMAPLPIIVGAVAIILISGIRFEKDKQGRTQFKFDGVASVKGLSNGIATIAKHLPKPALEKYLSRFLPGGAA